MNFSNMNRRLLLLLGAALAGCQSAPERQLPPPVAVAEAAVMARHDSLMAQMDQLFLLRAQINKTHAPYASYYLRGLADADQAMMAWMHQYRAPDTAVAASQRLAYFQAQHRRLAVVARRFRGAIDSATVFLRPVPGPGAHHSTN